MTTDGVSVFSQNSEKKPATVLRIYFISFNGTVNALREALTGVVTAVDLSKNQVYSVKDLNIFGENSY